MGRDKAFIEIAGKPLIEAVIAVAREVSDEVILVAPDAQRLAHLGLPVLAEEAPGQGPLEAMRVGLDAISAPAAFVLACDLPGLSAPPLEKMRTLLKDETDAIVPRENDRDHPLCALYHKRCGKSFESSLKDGERAVHRALASLQVLHPTGEDLGAPEGFFDNLNTPEDLEATRK